MICRKKLIGYLIAALGLGLLLSALFKAAFLRVVLGLLLIVIGAVCAKNP